MEIVTIVSGETSKGMIEEKTEENMSYVNEVSSVVTEVSDMSNNQEGMADELTSVVSKFKL